MGRMPFASSCTASRLEKVVLPEEDGPAISTRRTWSRRWAICVAIWPMRCACERLGDQDDLLGAARLDRLVERSDIADAEHIQRAAVLPEHIHQLGIGDHRLERPGRRAAGSAG